MSSLSRFRVLQHSLAALCMAAFLSLAAQPATAFEIQELTTDRGITVWLVEEHSIPIIAMRFAFAGGSASDPEDRQGLTNTLSVMLDEGAGDLDSQAFQAALARKAVKLSFTAGRDTFSGEFNTLTENRDEAFALLRLAINEPRFDADPLARMKTLLLQSLARDAEDPETVAVRAWMKQAFGDHPYARNPDGTEDGISAVTADDLRALAGSLFVRDGLQIAVVGDIDPETLRRLLDTTFGDLPQSGGVAAVADATVSTEAGRVVIDMDIPQAVIQFGHRGILRDDPDFIPAYIMNHILGGGGLSSRLTEEIREKRGLTYSVYSYLSAMDHAGLFLGQTSTQSERAGETVQIIEAEVARMAESGPTEKELEDAKRYLVGSYALRFDTSSKIAGQLLGIQLDDLGIDYIEKRNSMIEAVTVDDVRRVARELLHPDELMVTIVGRPVGIAPASAD